MACIACCLHFFGIFVCQDKAACKKYSCRFIALSPCSYCTFYKANKTEINVISIYEKWSPFALFPVVFPE
jgi:hypothetical protein